MVFALKLGTGGSAQATGEFDGEGDSVFIVWAARVMFAHFGLGFDANLFVTHFPTAAGELLDGFWGHITEGVVDGELANGEAELGNDTVVLVGGGSWVNGGYGPLGDFAGFLDVDYWPPFSAEDG